ncbi:MAG: hypothetical protein NWF05_07400 [Candidatus Bathyarchaeota archaeon]|nr:hypothetical protein [Candidatus Bathyarchaeota archaeon]
MSLTLRDAQHLAWKTLKKLEKIDETRMRKFCSATELAIGAGEVEKKTETLEKSSSPESKEELARLLSNLLFSLFVLSELNGISLEDSFLQSVDDLILEFVS